MREPATTNCLKTYDGHRAAGNPCNGTQVPISTSCLPLLLQNGQARGPISCRSNPNPQLGQCVQVLPEAGHMTCYRSPPFETWADISRSFILRRRYMASKQLAYSDEARQ